MGPATYQRTGKYKIVKPDQSKNYLHVSKVLHDLGFGEALDEIIEEWKNFKKIERAVTVYHRDGKQYIFVSMNHFNAQIYSIRLAEID